KKAQLSQIIAELLTEQDRFTLVSIANANISPTPEAMADFFMGGHDCKHKNVHPADNLFLKQLPWVIEQRAREHEKRAKEAAKKENKLPVNFDAAQAFGFEIDPLLLTT